MEAMEAAAFHARVAELLRAGQPFGTARLIDFKGSVPQAPGAAMIVHPGGAIEGTIGGGRFEAAVTTELLGMLQDGGRIALRTYTLSRDELGMYCAGQAQVLLEAFAPAAELVIFGGGHVGAALVRLARQVGGFRITVVDDRLPYAAPEHHPDADRVVHTDPTYTEGLPALGPWSYAVLVTRCHEVDRTLLARLAPLDLAYLGMIGSRAKWGQIRRLLEREGIAPAQLDRVHAPIGLDLGRTKRPEEVALSILAEVVRTRNQREARRAAAARAAQAAGGGEGQAAGG
ncbi:MAG: xanthine dehydrogenase [Planctomycetota bacterium]|nr:MAG: xanthine dehydrogenase [Planctomycetota bacterium]